ncbi:MAG: DUF559 domain-containing protein, partial [Chloroflexi bacterium]|nr:DUF559 domain-containing protein [Chloroflexota bacterium]
MIELTGTWSSAQIEVAEANALWLAGPGELTVWLFGASTACMARVPRSSLYDRVPASDPPAVPRAAYLTPLRGRPNAFSQAEMHLEAHLSRSPWATGRAWNQTWSSGVLANSIRVDLIWAQEKCVVELDGPDHLNTDKYAADRVRDRALQREGFMVLRYTNDEVLDDVARVLGELERFLEERRRGPQGVPRLPVGIAGGRQSARQRREDCGGRRPDAARRDRERPPAGWYRRGRRSIGPAPAGERPTRPYFRDQPRRTAERRAAAAVRQSTADGALRLGQETPRRRPAAGRLVRHGRSTDLRTVGGPYGHHGQHPRPRLPGTEVRTRPGLRHAGAEGAAQPDTGQCDDAVLRPAQCARAHRGCPGDGRAEGRQCAGHRPPAGRRVLRGKRRRGVSTGAQPDVPEPPPAEPDDPGRGPGACTREDYRSRIGSPAYAAAAAN